MASDGSTGKKATTEEGHGDDEQRRSRRAALRVIVIGGQWLRICNLDIISELCDRENRGKKRCRLQ